MRLLARDETDKMILCYVQQDIDRNLGDLDNEWNPRARYLGIFGDAHLWSIGAEHNYQLLINYNSSYPMDYRVSEHLTLAQITQLIEQAIRESSI